MNFNGSGSGGGGGGCNVIASLDAAPPREHASLSNGRGRYVVVHRRDARRRHQTTETASTLGGLVCAPLFLAAGVCSLPIGHGAVQVKAIKKFV